MTSSGPLFSREQLQENHRGVEDLIPSTIAEFLNYIPEMQEDLKTAFDKKEQEELTRAAHSLKGAVASVCSEPMRAVAYKIETLSRENSTDEIPALIDELKAGLNQLSKDLESYQKELENAG